MCSGTDEGNESLIKKIFIAKKNILHYVPLVLSGENNFNFTVCQNKTLAFLSPLYLHILLNNYALTQVEKEKV